MSFAESDSDVRTNVQLARDVLAERLVSRRVPNTKPITSMELSWDGRYLAIGDDQGRVTLRDMEFLAKRAVIFNAGKDVGITALLWSRASNPWALFIASGNGYLNCVSFYKDFEHQPPHNAALKCCGLITCMSLNDDESQLAVSYDYTTKIYPLPFEEGDPIELGASAGFLVNKPYFSGRQWYRSPVRDHPRAVSIHYLAKHLLCIASFGKIEAYDTSPDSDRNQVWEIAVPKTTNIGSCTLSPSRKLLAATNLHSGIDWYSLETLDWLSETPIKESYETKNRILPVRFLTEHTFVAGSNVGQVVIGTYGVVATKPIGKKRFVPSQYLTVFCSPSKTAVVYASGCHVAACFIDLPLVQKQTPSGSSVVGTYASRAAAPVLNTTSQHSSIPLQPQGPGNALEPSAPPATSIVAHRAQVPFHTALPPVPPRVGDLLGPEFSLEKGRDVHETSVFQLAGEGPSREILSVEAGRNIYHTPDGDTGIFESFRSPEGLASQQSLPRSPYSPSDMTISVPPSPLDQKSSFQPASISLVQDREQHPSLLRNRDGNLGPPKEVSFAPHQQPLNASRPRAEFPFFDAPLARIDSQEPYRRRRQEDAQDSPTEAQPIGHREKKDAEDADGSMWSVYSSRIWRCTLANPKITSVIAISIAAVLLAFLCRGSTGKGQALRFPDAGHSSRMAEMYSGGDNVEDEDADDEDEDANDPDTGDRYGDYDTVILTETKVLTVTRTVTHTATFTTTVTANAKPRRTPKSRRR